MEKTAGVGHFQIPTAPAAGVSVTSGAANVYTTTPVQLIAATAAALYITGIYCEEAAVSAATYKSVQLMIGAAAAETIIGQYLVDPKTGSTVTRTYRPIHPSIPVANGIRISAKTADSVGALATLVSLEVIAQTNVVDAGITVGANVLQWNSTNVAAPATAGIPEVNLKNIANAAVATGTAQLGVNLVNIAGAAVATGTAQLGVNVVNYGGAAGTFAGGRPEVNTTHWRGTALAAPTTAGIPRVAIEAAADFAQAAADKAWATAIRILTASTNFNDLSAAGVRTAVGLAAANLDTQLSNINTKTTNLPLDPADASDIAALLAVIQADTDDLQIRCAMIQKLLRNKTITNPATGVMTVYDDDSVTPLFTCNVFEDVGGAQTYRGQGADRRDRLA